MPVAVVSRQHIFYSDKYISGFGQICFGIRTNMFCDLEKSICKEEPSSADQWPVCSLKWPCCQSSQPSATAAAGYASFSLFSQLSVPIRALATSPQAVFPKYGQMYLSRATECISLWLKLLFYWIGSQWVSVQHLWTMFWYVPVCSYWTNILDPLSTFCLPSVKMLWILQE